MPRAESVTRNVEVPATVVTGPLISRRRVSIIWKPEEKMSALRGYDEMRAELNREKRGDAEADAPGEEVKRRLPMVLGSKLEISSYAEKQ